MSNREQERVKSCPECHNVVWRFHHPDMYAWCPTCQKKVVPVESRRHAFWYNIDRERIAEPIRCEVVCKHYSECYPYVNPVGCTKIELWNDIAASVEHAGYTHHAEPAEDRVEAVATGIRRFTMFRKLDMSATHDTNQANPPNEPQFEGVIFTDGKCVIRWLTAKRSVAVWDCFEDMISIHGHPEYGSEIVWHDQKQIKEG